MLVILVSGACGCAAPPAESGRVHAPRRSYEGCGSRLTSGVREGSPPRRSYEGCGSC